MWRKGTIPTLHTPFEFAPVVLDADDETTTRRRSLRRGRRSRPNNADAVTPTATGGPALPSWGPHVGAVAGYSDSGSDEASGATAAIAGGARRPIGRPIMYTGDINARHLTEAERRCLKRRVANRESARRVRAKRQEAAVEMQAQLAAAKGNVAALQTQLQQAGGDCEMLAAKVSQMRGRLLAVVAERQDFEGRQAATTAAAAASAALEAPPLQMTHSRATKPPPAVAAPSGVWNPESPSPAPASIAGGTITSGCPTSPPPVHGWQAVTYPHSSAAASAGRAHLLHDIAAGSGGVAVMPGGWRAADAQNPAASAYPQHRRSPGGTLRLQQAVPSAPRIMAAPMGGSSAAEAPPLPPPQQQQQQQQLVQPPRPPQHASTPQQTRSGSLTNPLEWLQSLPSLRGVDGLLSGGLDVNGLF